MDGGKNRIPRKKTQIFGKRTRTLSHTNLPRLGFDPRRQEAPWSVTERFRQTAIGQCPFTILDPETMIKTH